MGSVQAGSTDQEYLAFPEHGPGIGFFRSKLTWDAGTTTGDFVPPDESGIQVIYDFTVHNITPAAAFINQAWRAEKIYDATVDKQKITITGPANQIWLVTMIGASRR